jgi:hypothetical protein
MIWTRWIERLLVGERHRQRLVYELSTSPAVVVDYPALRAAIAHRLRELAGGERALFCELRPVSKVYAPVAGDGLDPGRCTDIAIHLDGSLVKWLSVNEEVMGVPDPRGAHQFLDPDERAAFEAHDVRLCVPLISLNRLLGLVLGGRLRGGLADFHGVCIIGGQHDVMRIELVQEGPMTWLRFAACALAGLVAVAAAPAAQPSPPVRAYVTVLDAQGNAVEGLPAAAFHVREDGVDRPVTAVARATQPPAITVIVHGILSDDTPSLRTAVAGLVDIVRRAEAETRMAVVASVKTPRLVNITAGAADLRKDIDGIYEQPTGLVLFEAIDAACQALKAERSDRRVVFVVDNAWESDNEVGVSNRVGQALRDAGAELWVLEWRPASGVARGGTIVSGPPQNVNTARDRMILSWTTASGGYHDTIVGATSLPDTAARLARLILSQYAVTYARPAHAAPHVLQIGVAAPAGTKVIAPQWPPAV